jgi:PST family polysaccharide transporter
VPADWRQPDVVRVTTPTVDAIARGLSWTGLGRVVSQTVAFGSLAALAALVPPKAFGTVAVGMAIFWAATLLMESGTGGGIIVSDVLTGEQLRGYVVRNVAIGLAFTAVVAVLADPMVRVFAKGADPDVLRVLVASIAITAVGIAPLALLNKTMNFKRRAQATVAASIIATVASVAAAIAGADVWALVLRLVLNQTLLSLFAWIAVRDIWPRTESRRWRLSFPRTGGSWFMLATTANFMAFSLDNLVVGRIVGVHELGLYALAFTLGFAPLSQVSWQLGGVLMPTFAATEDPARVRRRVLKALRMMSLLLLPLPAPVIALAPAVIPAVFGDEWRGMVLPFQILLAVGVLHGILNVLAETFAGTGNIAFRARVDIAWATLSIIAVAVFTQSSGITGAAMAHVTMFFILAVVYVTSGVRRVGLSPVSIIGAVGGIAGCVAIQAVATTSIILGARQLGAEEAVAAAAAGCGAVIIVAALLHRLQGGTLGEARRVVSSLRRQPA